MAELTRAEAKARAFVDETCDRIIREVAAEGRFKAVIVIEDHHDNEFIAAVDRLLCKDGYVVRYQPLVWHTNHGYVVTHTSVGPFFAVEWGPQSRGNQPQTRTPSSGGLIFALVVFTVILILIAQNSH